jgi:hypothetical protein
MSSYEKSACLPPISTLYNPQILLNLDDSSFYQLGCGSGVDAGRIHQ